MLKPLKNNLQNLSKEENDRINEEFIHINRGFGWCSIDYLHTYIDLTPREKWGLATKLNNLGLLYVAHDDAYNEDDESQEPDEKYKYPHNELDLSYFTADLFIGKQYGIYDEGIGQIIPDCEYLGCDRNKEEHIFRINEPSNTSADRVFLYVANDTEEIAIMIKSLYKG